MSGLNPKRPWPWLGLAAAMSVAVGLYGSLGGYAALAQEGSKAISGEHVARVEALSEAFKQTARAAGPAVVQITSTAVQKQAERSGGTGDGRQMTPEDLEELPEPFREFFKEYGGKGLPVPPPQRRTGSGSGVIIDAEKGLILTNNHVVGVEPGSKQEVDLRVKLAGGRRNYKARVVGQDPKVDVALIQIEADNLQAVKLGDTAMLAFLDSGPEARSKMFDRLDSFLRSKARA